MICTACHTEQTDFYKGRKICKSCLNKRNKQWRAEQRQKFQEYKASLSCEVCGFSHPAALDFHHPDPNKEAHVADMINARSFDRTLEEVLKCRCLCSNCHRIEHWGVS